MQVWGDDKKGLRGGKDQIVRYVTLACSCGGKARNKTLSVAKWSARKTKFTPVLNFGHPKKGRPRFLVVLEYLNVASSLQKQYGCPKVRFANDEEDIDDDDDDDDILTLPIIIC
ncbi:hypothetical protein LWI28_021577 [Acer negundo]|uniref:Uncharacterized protein n=1 Tax=Acer negundo TaxID=4023 RepID=A0AAD5NSY9_ACENE|nr:hypothetical protein LWI28_021577 [Acer negundo]